MKLDESVAAGRNCVDRLLCCGKVVARSSHPAVDVLVTTCNLWLFFFCATSKALEPSGERPGASNCLENDRPRNPFSVLERAAKTIH